MVKVRRLEIAAAYLDILQEIEKTSNSAADQLLQSPRLALRSYAQLRSLSHALIQAQPEAEGAAPHLIDWVTAKTNHVEKELHSALSKDFKTALDEMQWPQKDLNLSGDILSVWTEKADLLLDLQEPKLLLNSNGSQRDANLQADVLLPLEIMVKPLAQRFRYHFFGDRPTNRLDKPEYFLSHIEDLLECHSPFITEALQPILDLRTRSSEDLETLYPGAISCFITALLPLVMEKALSVLPQISSQPQLLSHFMRELGVSAQSRLFL
jgi:hypothetical protein